MKSKWTVIGSLLITMGMAIIGWTLIPHFIHGAEAKTEQKATVEQLEKSWEANVVKDSDIDRKKTVSAPDSESLDGIAEGQTFGVVTVPAFGADWKVPAAQGTTQSILDNIGAGHYKNTEGPGEIGNFVLAGHNSYGGYGAFQRIPELKAGQEIIITTGIKRYVYKFRSSEIVKPTQSEVLYPVPHKKDAKATEALLTMTTCWPAWSDQERWISYAVLDRVEDR